MIEQSDIVKHVPGVLGSLTAVFLLKDTWPRRALLFFAGWSSAHFVAPTLARFLAIDAEVAGFLVGLFSMAIVAKGFEVVEAIQPKDLIDRILKRVGL